MRDILFMGTILASVTHDMQNIMAIIKESGALAGDIMSINKGVKIKHGDKLAFALGNIGEQVARGRNMMLMLNGFAHAAADHPEVSDLVRFTRQIGVLAERMARLKECTLAVDLPDKQVPVRGNALFIMQAVYFSLTCLYEVCGAGDHVKISLLGDDKGPLTTLRIKADKCTVTPQCADLDDLMHEFGSHYVMAEGAILLTFPLSSEEKGADLKEGRP